MNRKQRISKILQNNLNDFTVNIVDNSYKHQGHNQFDGKGETHIQIFLKNKSNKKPDRLQLHRKINNLLENEFKSGLHSLEITIN